MQDSDFYFNPEYPNQVPEGVTVSVLMITYNHGAYISQSIESILSQKTNFDFELCIGEDESCDETRAICIKYAKKYPEIIRLFLRRRVDVPIVDGRPNWRYNGIETLKACRGKYIAHCEGDDFWIDEHKLQKQYDFMEANHEYAICATLGIERTEGSNVPDVIKPTYGAKDLHHNWFVSGRTGVLTGSIFYRSELILRDFVENLNVMIGDWALLVSLTHKNRKCGILPFISVVYRLHGGGVWTSNPNNAIFKMRTLKRAYQEYLQYCENGDYSQVQQLVDLLEIRLKYLEAKKGGMDLLRFVSLLALSTSGRRFIFERIKSRCLNIVPK